MIRPLPRLRTLRQLDFPTLRAAWWAWTTLRRTRRALRELPVAEVDVVAPPLLPPHAARGVNAVLRRVPNTCLERALVLQKWLAEHGVAKDVVVGVTGRDDFRAHAWLEGESVDGEYRELTRLRLPVS